jgi:ferredoxin
VFQERRVLQSGAGHEVVSMREQQSSLSSQWTPAEWDKVSGFTTKQQLDCVALAAAECPVMALSGHPNRTDECPLWGEKRT